MALTPEISVKILRGLDFNLYHGKSSGESLLVHSLGVYSLVHAVLPFTQSYSDADKEVMRWAALLHDYGKTSANWQRAVRGPHRVSLGDIKYEELRSILKAGIDGHSPGTLTEADVDDILFIIEFHHDSGRRASTPARSRMKDVVSECDRAVSQQRISDALVRALNPIIDTVRYRLFTVELMEHPISPLVIGAFDYVLAESGSVTPLLYSPTSTLNIGPLTGQLPLIEEVNRFLKDQFGGSKGVLRYDGSNTRIYTEERSFLELASDPDAFIAEATAFANEYCARNRKAAERNPGRWSDEMEDVYLYGRVCGVTYNTLLALCNVDKKQLPRAYLMAGGRHGAITAQHMQLLGFRQPGTTYEQTLLKILERLSPFVRVKLDTFSTTQEGEKSDETFRYDVWDLLVPDTDAYPAVRPRPLDPKAEATRDYERYMRKEPLETCPACSQFPQGNLSAAAFPQISPLGGTVEVFYTTHMRLIKKEPPVNKGVSFCGWCSKWWDLIATDRDGRRQLYRLCIMPHHLFGRLEWREILGPAVGERIVQLGASGTVSSSGVYPHIAVIPLRGTDREAVLRELTADPERGVDQIADRLYKYGLKGAVIVSNPVSSRHLLTCGSISIDAAKWPILRTPLRLLSSAKRSYARAITELQRSPYAFGTFLADGSIKGTDNEVRKMVEELAEQTGLAFLRDIWIGGKNRVDSAGKVIRGMNETLRRLKEREDRASLVDAMTGKGLHLALSTRGTVSASGEPGQGGAGATLGCGETPHLPGSDLPTNGVGESNDLYIGVFQPFRASAANHGRGCAAPRSPTAGEHQMMKYQVVVLRRLKGFGQFVTESRDEVNTYEFGDGDERPIIFGEKLKAVERRTIMRKVREVLQVNCWLTTHKKGGDAGISGLCMSCPACALFGGTYAPKKGGSSGPKNVVEMRRAYYTAAFPFQGGGIRDVTFNAVDERTGQTGQALGTNQIIEPRDFIDVVTVEGTSENWVKLVVWGIEHSDRYGANTRIYGEIHNEVLGVVVDTRLRIAAIDLARLDVGADVVASVKKHLLETMKLVLMPTECTDDEIAEVIENLTKDEAVEDLARRKNSVDASVEEYFEKTAMQMKLKLPVEKKDGKEVRKRLKVGERLAFLTSGKKSQYQLARDIEKANFAEPEDAEEEAAP